MNPLLSVSTNSRNDRLNYHKRECERTNVPPDIVIKAEEGDAAAQLQLGKTYFNTTSVENHGTISFDWIRRSAEQGNTEAQFRLGDLYALGFGTGKSFSDSYRWYTKAAIQGYKKALIRIHNLYQEDVKIHCRGKLNSLEVHDSHEFRELFEWRLNKYQTILNHAIEYYSNLFKSYQSSNQNDTNVQLNLAFLYQHGYGVKKCSRWAFEYYSLAAEQGDADAQYNLGHLYQQHTDKKFNYRNAFKWYTKSAQGGNVAAQRFLAYFYLKGLATDINYEVAVFWYNKAAEAGDSQSQVILGKLYRKGNCIIKDLSVAVKWYTLAARQGNSVAQNCLSQLYQRGMLNNIEFEEDILEYITEDSMNNRLCTKLSLDISKITDSQESKVIDKLAKHALMGDGPSMFEIGLRYYHGNRGFSQDKDTAIKWIKNSAKREHEEAQFFMAKLYKDGDSVEQEYHKSTIWYRTIAKHKNHVAQCQIGIMYNKGLGVREDPLEASKWFIWAADQENSDAQFNLGMFRLEGRGIRMDLPDAKEWFNKSILQKNTQACYDIGKMYFNDDSGLEKNQKTSLLLLEFAAKHNHADAQSFLGYIYENGDGVQQDIQKSIGYYTKAADSGNGEAQYELAIINLNRDGVDHDFIKTYYLFKRSNENGYYLSDSLFQIQIKDHPYPYIKDYSKVIDMFTEVTKKEIDDLTYNIGSIYEFGVKVRFNKQRFHLNYNKAKEWYLIASNKGDSRADYRLGIMYENGNGVEINVTTAIYYYTKAVENANSDAMYRLAYIYLNDIGVAQNLLKAFHLFTKASNMGHAEATEILTILEKDIVFQRDAPIFQNQDTEKLFDRKNLITMLEKTTEKGYTQLQYQLGVMYERNNNNLMAAKWFQLAADIGVTDACYRLGAMYEKGRGVRQNYSLDASMYQKAAEKDHEDACYRLGRLYQYGNGVQCDYLKAYSFYKKAAVMNHDEASKILNITLESKIQSNGSAKKNFFDVHSKNYKSSLLMCKYVAENDDPAVQFQVGFAYENSYSKPNYKEAFKWYSMAAKRLHREAMYRLGFIYEKGLGVSQNYRKAIRLYNQAHQLGNDDAINRLGIVYHHGKGVDIDPLKAVDYYILSAKLGNPEYQCELGRLYQEGELVQKNLLEALKWYTKAYLQGYDKIGPKLYAIYEDKPYESFFFKKLVQNLSVASCNYFTLNEEEYEYEHYGDINNRLGSFFFFGQGTKKNLEKSLQYFLKDYSYLTRKSINDFGFFQYPGLNFSQRIDILNQFEKNKGYMDLLKPEELYILGMVYYNGLVEAQNKRQNIKRYIPIDNQNVDDPNQQIVLTKDYLKAWSFLERAANERHPKALFQVGIMCCYGYGVTKDDEKGNKYFDMVPTCDNGLIGEIALLYHTDNNIQNLSKALTYYKKLDGNSGQAIIGLGLLYEYGDGVEQDYQGAIEYYEKAVDDNNKVGYLRLGLMHYYGKGVPVDYEKALDLFEEAIYGSFDYYTIPYVYDQSNMQTSDDNASQRKLVYCTKDSLEVNGESYYYLGLMYKHGQGVPKDEDEAQKYFRMALEEGCQRAIMVINK